MVSATSFHPMLGHVSDGQQIQFADRVLTLSHTMRGWVFIASDGSQVGTTMPTASDVMRRVDQLSQQ